MRLITINEEKEPECIKALKNKGACYEDLKDDCLKIIRDILFKEQQGYCAYCEQKFKSTVFIEHYITQFDDKDRDLDFSNFLGVCSGKEYFDPKVSPKHISHCGNKRSSEALKIDPKIKEHINLIYFESDASIRSRHKNHDINLNNTLNLNFDILKERRNAAYQRNLKNLLNLAQLLKLSKQQIIEKGITNALNGLSEFGGYLKFRYNQMKTTST